MAGQMAGQRGRDVRVMIGDGGAPETFALVAGIRARTIAMGARLLDATTAQSPQAWRELIAGARRVDVSGSGAFVDAASDARMRSAFFAGETPAMRIEVAAFGAFVGPFAIADLTYGGEHDGEATMSMRLSSAGAVTFEAG